jgi:glutathione S-transferase
MNNSHGKEKTQILSTSSLLLSTSSGPFCHRVLLAAGEKQVPLTLGYIDFASKPDW